MLSLSLSLCPSLSVLRFLPAYHLPKGPAKYGTLHVDGAIAACVRLPPKLLSVIREQGRNRSISRIVINNNFPPPPPLPLHSSSSFSLIFTIITGFIHPPSSPFQSSSNLLDNPPKTLDNLPIPRHIFPRINCYKRVYTRNCPSYLTLLLPLPTF